MPPRCPHSPAGYSFHRHMVRREALFARALGVGDLTIAAQVLEDAAHLLAGRPTKAGRYWASRTAIMAKALADLRARAAPSDVVNPDPATQAHETPPSTIPTTAP